jgi:hypothetical protein
VDRPTSLPDLVAAHACCRPVPGRRLQRLGSWSVRSR